MTITVNDTRDEYTSGAGQTVFNYTFKIFASTDLNVYQTPAGQDPDDSTDIITAYTVAGVGDEDGGSITLTVGASAGDLITIVSDIPSSRTTDYQNNGDFLPDTVNDDFDRVVSLVKQVEDVANRTVVLEQSQQGPKPLTLPSPESQKFLRWKTDLSGFENVPSTVTSTVPVAALSSYANLADAIAQIGSTVSELWLDTDDTLTGNVTSPSTLLIRPVNGDIITTDTFTWTHNGPVVSGTFQWIDDTAGGSVEGLKYAEPEWWGVDGVADNVQIQSAIDAVAAGGLVMLSATTYQIASAIWFTGAVNVTLKGVGASSVLQSIDAIGDVSTLRVNGNGVVVRDLLIDGNRDNNPGATQQQHCIQIQAGNANNIVDNCWLFETVGDGVYVGEDTQDIQVINNIINNVYRNGVSDIGGWRHLISGNIITFDDETTNIVAGIDLEPNFDKAVEDIIISNNIIHKGGDRGISVVLQTVTTDSLIKNILVSGNIVNICDDYGIYLDTARYVHVTGNSVYDAGSDGVRVDADSFEIAISNNYIQNAGRYGIITLGDKVTVKNNDVIDSAEIALYATACDNIYMDGNYVFTDYNSLVCQLQTVNDFTFTNNVITSSAADTANYGVRIRTTTNGHVTGNTISNMFRGINVFADGGDSVWVHDNFMFDNTTDVVDGRTGVTGAITLSKYGRSLLDSRGGAVTATLPDGIEPGQVKVIGMTFADNASTVSVTHHETSDPEVFTFDATTDVLMLMWNGLEWVTLSNIGVTV